MLSIVRKVRGLSCRDLYFSKDIEAAPVGEDLQYWLQAARPLPNSAAFHTSILNLEKDVHEIQALLKKNVAYEIRRAASKDAVAVMAHPEPGPPHLAAFSEFYDLFASSKNLAGANRSKLSELANNGALVISFATTVGSAAWLCAHAYIVDGRRARLLYSASAVSPDSDRQLVGRANKYMHWEMILYFRKGGFAQYDFGGISKRPELKSVDEFKESFGGSEVVEFNALKGVTVKGKAAVLSYRVLSAWRNFKLVRKS